MTAAGGGNSSSTVEESDHIVKVRDGHQMVVRVYKGPKSQNGPVMVVLHGGGWVLGGLDNEVLLCRTFCEKFNGLAVNVDYRLAPEVKFPTPVHDCYDAVKWTAENQSIHGGDFAKGFILAGVSAGANMAISCSHLADDENFTPKVTGVYLHVPSALAPQAVPEKWKSEYTSREDNRDAPILSAGSIQLFRSKY